MFEAEAWYWARARGERVPGWATALRSMLPWSHADALGDRLRLGGPRETVVTACSSGAASVAEAAELIADRVVDVALVGGADAVTRICFMGFNALKLLDPEPVPALRSRSPRHVDRRGRGVSRARGRRARAGARGPRLCRARRRGDDDRRLPRDRAAPRRRRHGARDARPRSSAAGVAPGDGGLRQRARHRHAAERSHRGRGARAGVRRRRRARRRRRSR